jgi:hypothetical protein
MRRLKQESSDLRLGLKAYIREAGLYLTLESLESLCHEISYEARQRKGADDYQVQQWTADGEFLNDVKKQYQGYWR